MSDDQNITVSDNYGRSKRAALSYTGLLAVLTFTKGVPAATIAWSGIQLSLAAAQWLAWFAACYFTIGFCLEWRIALRNNSQLIRQDSANNVKTRLAALAAQFDGMATTVEKGITDFDAATKEIIARLEPINPSKYLLNQYKKYVEPPKPSPEAAYSTLLSMRGHQDEMQNQDALKVIERELESIRSEIERGKQDLGLRLTAIREAAERQNAPLSSLSADFKKLADVFDVEQKAVFYVYDLWATLIFFAATTVFSVAGGLCVFQTCPSAINYI